MIGIIPSGEVEREHFKKIDAVTGIGDAEVQFNTIAIDKNQLILCNSMAPENFWEIHAGIGFLDGSKKDFEFLLLHIGGVEKVSEYLKEYDYLWKGEEIPKVLVYSSNRCVKTAFKLYGYLGLTTLDRGEIQTDALTTEKLQELYIQQQNELYYNFTHDVLATLRNAFTRVHATIAIEGEVKELVNKVSNKLEAILNIPEAHLRDSTNYIHHIKQISQALNNQEVKANTIVDGAVSALKELKSN
jgi:hypothetical protein